MKTFKLTIEYDGTRYSGWQRQASDPSIQAEIERALATMTTSSIAVIGAGRTDAGVHALGQVAHFRTDTRLTPEAFLQGLNSLLPADIAIRACQRAPDDFHARFAAVSKVYHYRLVTRPSRPAVGRDYAWFLRRPLKLEAMRQASRLLVGRHDFKAFESAGSPRAHTVRHVMAADWVAAEDGQLLTFAIEADGFLRGMVRAIVGTLVVVGQGRFEPHRVSAILESRDRRKAGATAPAHGLFLMEVRYPPAPPGDGDSPTANAGLAAACKP